MTQLTIRCHPYAPLATEELQRWLTREVETLRKGAPQAAIRLLRLTQPGPDGEVGVGWQIELGVPGGEAPLSERRLTELLSDLRLLGLQPSVLEGRPRRSDSAPAERSPDAEETGHASFPASDPSALWTWEVNREAGAPGANESARRI